MLFQAFCTTAEKPRLGLLVTVASGVTNMVLDAVLVITLPQEYKLAGAAAAALSQVVGGGVPLIYFGRKNSSLLRLGKCRLDGQVIRKPAPTAPRVYEQHRHEPGGMLYNLQLLHFAGEDGVAAYR